jgi:glycosyltransferase involved in cell wall biosynthesis
MTGVPASPRRSQRLVIVLPSTGEYDSRTWRIATSAIARGHQVTVVARWRPGVPVREEHPAGYTILRTPVTAIDGLPLPATMRRRLARKRYGPGAGHLASTTAPVTSAAATASASESSPAAGGPVRKVLRPVVRMAALALTVRAQASAVRALPLEADLVHAMAYMGIPVGLSLGRRLHAPVVYDARDIYTDANNLARLPGPFRRLLSRIERGWARSAAGRLTVNQPYAEVMASRWGTELPVIVMNCAYRFTPPAVRDRRFHEALRLPADARVVLYQGGLSPHRGIEQLIDAVPRVPDAHLVLLGYGPLEARLRADTAAGGGRVHVMAPVSPSVLLDWVAAADVVAMPIQPSTLNHRLTTPNKLFEAIAAGVPLVASDLPGMSGIVAEVGAGRLVDPTDRAAIADALAALLAMPEGERAAMTARELAAANDRYNWDAQAETLFAMYGGLTGMGW